MKERWLSSAPLAAIVAVAAACGGADSSQSEKERAIEAATAAYATARAEGTDFQNGPCIADPVIPGWVADVAHDPRQPVDDDPANQCAGYRSGESSHFVELDPNGNLIRAE